MGKRATKESENAQINAYNRIQSGYYANKPIPKSVERQASRGYELLIQQHNQQVSQQSKPKKQQTQQPTSQQPISQQPQQAPNIQPSSQAEKYVEKATRQTHQFSDNTDLTLKELKIDYVKAKNPVSDKEQIKLDVQNAVKGTSLDKSKDIKYWIHVVESDGTIHSRGNKLTKYRKKIEILADIDAEIEDILSSEQSPIDSVSYIEIGFTEI